MTPTRKLYVGTNLKMYKTNSQTRDYLSTLQELTKNLGSENLELFVIPSFTALSEVNTQVDHNAIKIGAQNMCWQDIGQFTGEVSPLMLKEVGVEIVELGHSERRHVFMETDDMIRKKVKCALAHNFIALLCVGEIEAQKALGLSAEVLKIQLKTALADIPEEWTERLWIAYEPVWAIGVNGKPASKEYVAEVHGHIRNVLLNLYPDSGSFIPILYGGSVNNENACQFIQQKNVDGLFIGRSAWDAQNFYRIIQDVIIAASQQ